MTKEVSTHLLELEAIVSVVPLEDFKFKGFLQTH